MNTVPNTRSSPSSFLALSRGWEKWARRTVAGNPRLRHLVYSARNRRRFADLAQHDRMLADTVRVDAYYEAIQALVRPGDVVVDLGTGSGVLAIFAAKAGAARVHAIEHGPIVAAARAVAEANGVDNIEFHSMHSRDFTLPEKADVILHEQIGEGLFDEGVVENVADLRSRVLKPGGRILPGHLRLFIEPVAVKKDALAEFAWEQQVHGVDFRALKAYVSTQPPSYLQPRYRPFPLEKFLAKPEPVVEIDLHTATPADLPPRLTYWRRATVDGVLGGLCVYFSAGFDDTRWFTSSPDAIPTSWGSPLLRVPNRQVNAGDVIEIEVWGPELSHPGTWQWDVAIRSGG